MEKANVLAALNDARDALDALISNEKTIEAVVAAAGLMADAVEGDGKVMSCGNGGSLCDAMHFAEEMTGRYRSNRRPYAALAISDASHMACVGNDYGYEEVFSRYVEAHGRKGDVLLAITTSGTSRNIVKAAEVARRKGVKVVALTGRDETPITELADVSIVTPAGRWADRVQELHARLPNTHLVMHGSSSVPQEYLAEIREFGGDMRETYGVPVEEIQKAIQHGVRKVNIDTDIRLAMTAAMRRYLVENPSAFDPRGYLKAARNAAKELCRSRYLAFGCEGQGAKIKPIALEKIAAKYADGTLRQNVI